VAKAVLAAGAASMLFGTGIVAIERDNARTLFYFYFAKK
jgi:hypothetical protein